MTTILVQPVKGKDGKLAGLLLATLPLDEIAAESDQVKFFDTGYTYITDTDGMVIGYNKVPDLLPAVSPSRRRHLRTFRRVPRASRSSRKTSVRRRHRSSHPHRA